MAFGFGTCLCNLQYDCRNTFCSSRYYFPFVFADPEVTPPTVRNTKSTKPSSSMLYGDDKDLPILETGKKERYTVREAAKILLMEQGKNVEKLLFECEGTCPFL